MNQNAIGAIGEFLGPVAHLALGKHKDRERQDREDSSQAYIQNATPFWEGRRVIR